MPFQAVKKTGTLTQLALRVKRHVVGFVVVSQCRMHKMECYARDCSIHFGICSYYPLLLNMCFVIS